MIPKSLKKEIIDIITNSHLNHPYRSGRGGLSKSPLSSFFNVIFCMEDREL